MIEKIVSGGQTGVDRAALDSAISANITYGGWCPQGRLDEYGLIPSKYESLKEIDGNFLNDKENYDTRTKKNISDSDGTLIIIPTLPIPEKIKDGTLLTINEVAIQKKAYLIVDLSKPLDDSLSEVTNWLKNNDIRVLNIAGPRESSWEGIYPKSLQFLSVLFSKLELELSQSFNI